MEKSALRIIHLFLFLNMFSVDESTAQSLSNLISSLPTQQATNSTVVVTVTATPPATSPSQYWQVRWTLDGVFIGIAVFDYVAMNPSASVINTAFSRAIISVSMPMSPNNQFTSSLILRELQLSDSGKSISVESNSGGGASTPPPPLMFTLMVKDCPSTIPSNITVEATSYIYNAQGTFQCLNNGELFYSNETRPSFNDTTCLASATWSGQDNLQCWSAPTNVTIVGNLIVVEGNILTITCHYVDTTPIGSSSIFYVGDDAYTKPKDEALAFLSLQRSDNNKVVSCQAVTPYTQIPANNNTGRSFNHTINVQYLPDMVTNNIETSDYVINTNLGYLLRSDQNLTMNCVASESNPISDCMWTVCKESGSCTNITAMDNNCQISYDLDASSLVFCSAFNVIGSISSDQKNITVIPAIRSVNFSINGSNTTADNNIVISQLNESITLSCYIANADELNTTYTLHLPNNTIISDSNLILPSLQPSDTGKYTCRTNDQFASFETSTYLDVRYAPLQDMQPPPCIWAINQTDSCRVEFLSNPRSTFISLTLYEISVINDGSNEIISSDCLQTYYYNRTKVTSADNGTYVLTVYSSVFPNNVSIFFDVNVIDGLPTSLKTTTVQPTTNKNLGLVIGVSCTAAVIVILIIVFVIMYMRKRRGLKGPSNEAGNSNIQLASGPSNEAGNNNIQLASDDPDYIGVDEIATSNQASTTRQYEAVQPITDEAGYLQMRRQSSRASATGQYEVIQPITDEAGYLQTRRQNSTASASRQYEVIQPITDEAGYLQARRQNSIAHNYDDVIGIRNAEEPYEVVI